MAVSPNIARLRSLLQNFQVSTLTVNNTLAVTGELTNRRKTVTIDNTSRTLLASESGAMVFLGGSGIATCTLPAMGEAGVYFDFMTKDVLRHVINGGAGLLQGCIHHNTALTTIGRVAIADGVSITMHASSQAIGDRMRITSNGTNWYVEGLTNAAVGIAT
jgi:hypothetical protein|tara:strand:- start:1024 stop:1506 length:483 start_codon:yes stop_codon:yes gene_type:complete